MVEQLYALTADGRADIRTGYIRPKRGETDAEESPWLQPYLEESGIALDGDSLELYYEEPAPRGARIDIRPAEEGVLYGVETSASVDHVTVEDGEPLRVEEEIDGVHYRTRIWAGDM